MLPEALRLDEQDMMMGETYRLGLSHSESDGGDDESTGVGGIAQPRLRHKFCRTSAPSRF